MVLIPLENMKWNTVCDRINLRICFSPFMSPSTHPELLDWINKAVVNSDDCLILDKGMQWTVLHYIASFGSEEAFFYLLERSTDIKKFCTSDKNSMDPIDIAVWKGFYDFACTMMEALNRFGVIRRLPTDLASKQLISVIGHRGSGASSFWRSKEIESPLENTVVSFNKAFQNGASFVEFDVQLSKDL